MQDEGQQPAEAGLLRTFNPAFYPAGHPQAAPDAEGRIACQGVKVVLQRADGRVVANYWLFPRSCITVAVLQGRQPVVALIQKIRLAPDSKGQGVAACYADRLQLLATRLYRPSELGVKPSQWKKRYDELRDPRLSQLHVLHTNEQEWLSVRSIKYPCKVLFLGEDPAPLALLRSAAALQPPQLFVCRRTCMMSHMGQTRPHTLMFSRGELTPAMRAELERLSTRTRLFLLHKCWPSVVSPAPATASRPLKRPRREGEPMHNACAPASASAAPCVVLPPATTALPATRAAVAVRSAQQLADAAVDVLAAVHTFNALSGQGQGNGDKVVEAQTAACDAVQQFVVHGCGGLASPEPPPSYAAALAAADGRMEAVRVRTLQRVQLPAQGALLASCTGLCQPATRSALQTLVAAGLLRVMGLWLAALVRDRRVPAEGQGQLLREMLSCMASAEPDADTLAWAHWSGFFALLQRLANVHDDPELARSAATVLAHWRGRAILHRYVSLLPLHSLLQNASVETLMVAAVVVEAAAACGVPSAECNGAQAEGGARTARRPGIYVANRQHTRFHVYLLRDMLPPSAQFTGSKLYVGSRKTLAEGLALQQRAAAHVQTMPAAALGGGGLALARELWEALGGGC